MKVYISGVRCRQKQIHREYLSGVQWTVLIKRCFVLILTLKLIVLLCENIATYLFYNYPANVYNYIQGSRTSNSYCRYRPTGQGISWLIGLLSFDWRCTWCCFRRQWIGCCQFCGWHCPGCSPCWGWPCPECWPTCGPCPELWRCSGNWSCVSSQYSWPGCWDCERSRMKSFVCLCSLITSAKCSWIYSEKIFSSARHRYWPVKTEAS